MEDESKGVMITIRMLEKPIQNILFLQAYFKYLLVRQIQDSPKTICAIVIAYGCPLECEGKTALLKTPHTLDTGLRGTKLEPTWEHT